MSTSATASASGASSLVQHSFADSLALHQRNQQWQDNPYIPTWVDPNEVGLDQFFTRPEVAQDCYASLCQWMHQDGARPEEYHFIEPAAGTGAFFDLLPADRRVGVDIAAFRDEYERADFLSWQPEERCYALIGNPPSAIGRGWRSHS